MGKANVTKKTVASEYRELSGEHLEDWVYWAMIDDIRFDSTDQELEILCDEYEAESNKSGLTLNRRDLERILEDHRDFLADGC